MIEGKRLILLIDDDPDFTEMMRFVLENAQYRVLISNKPEEGLEKAKANPDLILLDLKMPGMNGHEVCKQLKEDERTLPIPIIMLTSISGTLDKVEAFNLGVSDYIVKNAPFEEILVRIKSVLKRSYPDSSLLSKQERDNRVMELRSIIDKKDIRTLYQPIVVLKTRKALGYEALARGPTGTWFENPMNLFAVATDSHLSFELDSLCMKLAVKRAEPFLEDALLFLNADPAVILSEYLKNLDFLKDSAVKPFQVCIEISERTYISNFKEFATHLKSLKPLGVMIVIDDLGEGYSSLKIIAELTPDFIKVDMSLVRNINDDKVKQSLVKIITELSKQIKSKLIAEGVETEAECETLISLGVEYGQGYLFARPYEFPVGKADAAKKAP
ncbi:MAG: EAL domain-containing protein [Candidatus Omnitrophica bacterium]|nr:EAL domain-containing protein [Candidatus Omnitrophota bacterium]